MKPSASKPSPETLAVNAFRAELARLAPSIALSVTWEHDEDARWDFDNPKLDPDDFQAWQSTVTAIVIGKLVEGNAYLGGTWEKYGDDPAKSNPDISGYLYQMVGEALDNLHANVPVGSPIAGEIETAGAFVKRTLRVRYDESMAAKG
jgi:hypothetical protein